MPAIVPFGARAPAAAEVLDGRDVVAVGGGGEVPHPALAEDVPQQVDVGAAERGDVGGDDRVALVEHRGLGRGQAHRERHEDLGAVRAVGLAEAV